MERPDEPATTGEVPERPASVRSDERRRLLRGGLAAGPVLLTIVSRPVLGQDLNCGSVQIQASLMAGTSLHAGCANLRSARVAQSSGLSPTYWSGRDVVWPGGYQHSTDFHSSTTGLNGQVFGTHSMRQVLRGRAGGDSYAEFGKYVVAALLNAAALKTPFLSQGTVVDMWNHSLSPGYYQVSPGPPPIQWNQAQILAYLKTTMSP